MGPVPKDDILAPRAVRRQILFIRVSDEEREAIAEAAANAGLPIVDYVRAAVRDAIVGTEKKQAKKSRRA